MYRTQHTHLLLHLAPGALLADMELCLERAELLLVVLPLLGVEKEVAAAHLALDVVKVGEVPEEEGGKERKKESHTCMSMQHRTYSIHSIHRAHTAHSTYSTQKQILLSSPLRRLRRTGEEAANNLLTPLNNLLLLSSSTSSTYGRRPAVQCSIHTNMCSAVIMLTIC
jgi:hypothetical protein